jgi:hypothetical protein
VLKPNVSRFNDFLANHPDEYGDLRMWHQADGSPSSINYPPSPIPPELFRQLFGFP